MECRVWKGSGENGKVLRFFNLIPLAGYLWLTPGFRLHVTIDSLLRFDLALGTM